MKATKITVELDRADVYTLILALEQIEDSINEYSDEVIKTHDELIDFFYSADRIFTKEEAEE